MTATQTSEAASSQQQPPLFQPLTMRGITLKNRIGVSPMCQYSSVDGTATDWHLVHLGSRAVGGAAMVMVEATAVEARGRISPEDMGIWDDKHIAPLAKIAAFMAGQGCLPAIQLAHAGRKACTRRPWEGGGPIKDSTAWKSVAPSAIPFAEGYQTPTELEESDLDAILKAFAAATRRALRCGFEIIEIHAAHGYLLHEFLSPLSNQRSDSYGGSLENRMRFPLMVVEIVRRLLPPNTPLLVRISSTDWAEAGGWDLQQAIEFCKKLKEKGVDMVDCSSGGTLPHATIPMQPGYQVPFSESIRREAGIATAAVGLITEPQQANAIIASQKADMVFLGREMLRDPYWPLHAAKALGADVHWPAQYGRAGK